MSIAVLVDERRWVGILLILSFAIFAVGGLLTVVGDKGNLRIFTLPAKEHLLAVANNPVVWRWANIFMGAAAIVLLAGFSLLTTILEAANERTLSRMGLLGGLLATVLWMIFSVFRVVVTIAVADAMMTTVPTYYEPLAQWAFGLFYVSAMIGFLALAAYGGALLRIELFPAWVGWVTLGYSLALLVLLLTTGDTLPAYQYVPPLLIGILFMVRYAR